MVNHSDVPPEFRPPRLWPTAVLVVVVLAASSYAAQASYKNNHRIVTVDKRSQTQLDLRCATQKQRLVQPAKTPMEVFLRAQAVQTYPRDCG